jgi:hypothetical protein
MPLKELIYMITLVSLVLSITNVTNIFVKLKIQFSNNFKTVLKLTYGNKTNTFYHF